jgi:very-short-patch-repair endonuclease
VDLTSLIEPARRRHGLITLDEWVRLGLAPRSWYWAIRTGSLEQLHPKVSRLPGAPGTSEQRILAAVLACGDGSMASHRSGLHLWDPSDPPTEVDVIVGRSSGVRLDGVNIHRPTDRADLRPVYRQSIPATNPLRVLLDIGAIDPTLARPALERLVVAGFVTPGAVSATLERHRVRGRAGTAALDAALCDWTMNDKPPDSVLEERMNALVLRFRLPAVEFHVWLKGYEVDFLVAGSRVVIECDGWATHGLIREKFENDRDRENVLVAAGYAFVHVTWRMIRRHPALVAHRVRDVLARHAPHLLVA